MDAGFQDVGAEALATAHLIVIVGVEEDQRVQVAVAGMKDVGAAQTVCRFHSGDGAQHLGQPVARNRRVHAHVVGTDASGRREGVLAPAPEAQALLFVGADLDACGAAGVQDSRHAPDLLVDLFLRAVALAEQDGRGVEVVAGVHEVFDGGGHALVHQFETGRNDARGNHAGHRATGRFDVGKTAYDAAGEPRPGQQPDGDFADHRQHALAADEHGQQVEARRVERW